MNPSPQSGSKHRSVRRCRDYFERKAHRLGFERIAGCDEAGRGCLFGPVFAAAVILSRDRQIRGLDDSKQIAPERRQDLAARIRERAEAWAVARAEAAEIDRINILEASRLAMRRAVEKLAPAADYLLIDFVSVEVSIAQESLVHGDARCRSIAAASILAKVDRDRVMCEYDRLHPEFGFARNKGYGTPEHLAALREYGPLSEHRSSFAPVIAHGAQRPLFPGLAKGAAACQ